MFSALYHEKKIVHSELYIEIYTLRVKEISLHDNNKHLTEHIGGEYIYRN